MYRALNRDHLLHLYDLKTVEEVCDTHDSRIPSLITDISMYMIV